MKILIIAPSWLGDFIMSQSLLKILKQQHPDCFISVYAPAFMRTIAGRMSEVDEFLVNPFAHGTFDLKKRFQEGQRLKAMHFDRAYVLPNSLKSALMPFFAGIKERYGFKGESRYVLLNRMRTDKEAFPLMVQRYAALAYDKDKVRNSKELPEIPYPSLISEPVPQETLHKLGLVYGKPWLGLGCGANYGPAKLWPVEYFAEVSAWWIKQGGEVLGLGTDKDKPTVQAILQHIPEEHRAGFHDIAGKTNLAEALDLSAMCRAAVCNDSGMMHTMAALYVPQVCIFGSTSTGYTPPLAKNALCLESTEPCHPCFARTCKFGTYACLKGITPEHVITTLSTLVRI